MSGGPRAPRATGIGMSGMSAAGLYAHALDAFRQGRAREAQALLQRLLQLAPAHADGWNLAGVVHASLQDHARAVACYRNAVAAGAGPGTWVNLGLAEQRPLAAALIQEVDQ